MTATLKDLVAFAYSMKRFQVTGGPGWVDSTHFDISAKSEGAAAFPQLRAMLEPMLADRFHLKIHRETKQQPVYELIVAKGGAKLREAGAAGLGVGGGRGRLNGRGADMATLAWALSEQLDRAVLDRTGLAGVYEFTLTWTPDGAQTNGDPETSLFSGIEDQLGLKLQPAKGAVETLVIDSAEKPDEN